MFFSGYITLFPPAKGIFAYTEPLNLFLKLYKLHLDRTNVLLNKKQHFRSKLPISNSGLCYDQSKSQCQCIRQGTWFWFWPLPWAVSQQCNPLHSAAAFCFYQYDKNLYWTHCLFMTHFFNVKLLDGVFYQTFNTYQKNYVRLKSARFYSSFSLN